MSRASSPRSPRTIAPVRRFLGPAAWVVGGQAYAKLMSFLSYFVMVRFIAPDEVGLVALCWLVIVVGDTFFDVGLCQVYVRDGVRGQRAESTLFWTLIGLAACWGTAALLMAPLIAQLFDEPRAALALAALALIYPVKALGSVQLSIQVVERRVSGVTLRDVVSATVGSALGIALAAGGAGAWALVARLVAIPAAAAALTAATTDWRPTAEFDRAWLREKLAFGVPLTAASNVHWLVVLQIEGYLIGHHLGLAALGIVQFAKKPTEVLAQLMIAIQSVHLLRELSSVRDSARAWRAALRRELLLYAGFGAAVTLASFGFAHLVIEPVWGARWSAAVPLVAVLGLAAPLIAMQAVANSALVARGALGALLRVNVAGAAIACALLWLAVQRGLVAVAVALAVALSVAGLMALAALRGRGPAPGTGPDQPDASDASDAASAPGPARRHTRT